MLKVNFIDDETILKPFYNQLLLKENIDGVNVVLYDMDKPIGLCKMSIGESVQITKLIILPESNTFVNNDFFIRAVLLKLTKVKNYVTLNGYDKGFEKFGFVKNGDDMIIYSDDINFPSDCH